MENVKRYLIIFRGRVQGVGFRFNATSLAQRLGLTGYVKNLTNGDVEVEVQGPSNKVIEFIKHLVNSDRWIRVDDYSCKEIPVKKDRGKFSARY